MPQLFIGPHHVHHGLGHILDHTQLVVIATVHHLLDIPLHLGPGVDHAVIYQVIYGHGKSVSDTDQCVETDPSWSQSRCC